MKTQLNELEDQKHLLEKRNESLQRYYDSSLRDIVTLNERIDSLTG